jgi:GNAT superfamily N-acetyltransferase
VIREIIPPETGIAFEVMRALRTDLSSERAFVEQVDERQRPEGYRLVAAFEEGGSSPAAVAGFRTGHSLSWGHYLYVDDLSTKPSARRRGYARALLEWLIEDGRSQGCDQLHLDSGVGIDRVEAHRLYLTSGLIIAAHHFARYVESGTSSRPAG